MCRIKYSTEPNLGKFKIIDFRNSILKYNIIYDALQIICQKNLIRQRNLDDRDIPGSNKKVKFLNGFLNCNLLPSWLIRCCLDGPVLASFGGLNLTNLYRPNRIAKSPNFPEKTFDGTLSWAFLNLCTSSPFFMNEPVFIALKAPAND